MDTNPNLDEDGSPLCTNLWEGGNYAHYWFPGRNGQPRQAIWIDLRKPIPKPPNKQLCTYFGVHPVQAIPQTNARGKAMPPESVRSQIKHIQCVNCLFSDFDVKDFDGSQEATIQHIRSIPVPPSVGVFSGSGYHCYWLLDKTAYISTEADRTYLQAVQSHWVDFVGGDGSARDLARLLRYPGTVNYKPKYAPNYPKVTMVKAEFDLRYNLDALALLCRAETHSEPPDAAPQPEFNGTAAEYVQLKMQTAARMIQGAEDGEKHPTLRDAAILVGGVVVPGGITEEEARAFLREAIEAKPTVTDMEKAFRTIDDGIHYGKTRPFTLPST